MDRIFFAAKRSWETLSMSRPLFVGSYWQVKFAFGQYEKEEKFASNDNSIWPALFCRVNNLLCKLSHTSTDLPLNQSSYNQASHKATTKAFEI